MAAPNNYKIGCYFDGGNILEAGFNTPDDPEKGGIWVCDKVRGYCIDEESVGKDFSVAFITWVNGTGASNAGGAFFGDEISIGGGEYVAASDYRSHINENNITPVILYKGKALLSIPDVTNTDGDIIQIDEEQFIVTGNCTVEVTSI